MSSGQLSRKHRKLLKLCEQLLDLCEEDNSLVTTALVGVQQAMDKVKAMHEKNERRARVANDRGGPKRAGPKGRKSKPERGGGAGGGAGKQDAAARKRAAAAKERARRLDELRAEEEELVYRRKVEAAKRELEAEAVALALESETEEERRMRERIERANARPRVSPEASRRERLRTAERRVREIEAEEEALYEALNSSKYSEDHVSQPYKPHVRYGASRHVIVDSDADDTRAGVVYSAPRRSPEPDSDEEMDERALYRKELDAQLREKYQRLQEQQAQERLWNRKKDLEIQEYDPWGKAGGGAPIKDDKGHVLADLRHNKLTNTMEALDNSPTGVKGSSKPQFFAEQRRLDYDERDHAAYEAALNARTPPRRDRDAGAYGSPYSVVGGSGGSRRSKAKGNERQFMGALSEMMGRDAESRRKAEEERRQYQAELDEQIRAKRAREAAERAAEDDKYRRLERSQRKLDRIKQDRMEAQAQQSRGQVALESSPEAREVMMRKRQDLEYQEELRMQIEEKQQRERELKRQQELEERMEEQRVRRELAENRRRYQREIQDEGIFEDYGSGDSGVRNSGGYAGGDYSEYMDPYSSPMSNVSSSRERERRGHVSNGRKGPVVAAAVPFDVR